MGETRGDRRVIDVGGTELTVTNLDKVLYPEAGTTKRDVLTYLAHVAPLMLPLVAGRPATRKRWVHGTGGEPFFHKDLDAATPPWVARRTLAHLDHTADYPLVDDLATLLWLGQIAALEVHVPQWRFPAGASRHTSDDGTSPERAYPPASGRLHPDRLVLDLDPGEGVGLPQCAHVAGLLRESLAARGLDAVPVTSGSKGIHLYAPLDGALTSDEATDLAREMADGLDAEHPGLVVTSIRKAERAGKVLIDWSQNRAGKTTVAPYSLRGRAQPWVAAPRTWQEIEDPNLRQLTCDEVVTRAAAGEDPAAALHAGSAQPFDRSVQRAVLAALAQ